LKKFLKTKTVFIILSVAVIMFLSFFGTYIIKTMPGLKMGMEFTESRKITATINEGKYSDTIYDSEGNEVTEKEEGVEYTEENGYKIVENKINPDEVRTEGSYELSKNIIKEKLEKLEVPQYNLNEENGTITIEIPEDSKTEDLLDAIQTQGSLLFLDSQSFENVFDSSYIESSQVVSRQGDFEAGIFLQINLTEEGKNKLKELEDIYIEKETEALQEDGTIAPETTTKEIIDILNNINFGQTVITNIAYNGTIMIPFAISNSNEELNEGIQLAQRESIILNAGITPIIYEFNDEVVPTTMEFANVLIYIIALSVIVLVLFIFKVVKFKAKGFIAFYFELGFLATLLLILRITDVTITIEGIVGIITAFIMNYIFSYIILENSKEKDMYKDSNLAFFLNTLPIYIISVVFTFSNKANISSFGMALFWGIIVTYIYNFLFSKFIFENIGGGKNENN